MIPENIGPDEIRKAIERIRTEGYPAVRASTKHDLVFEGERYPPKVVISYANAFANGEVLSHEAFSGGPETNDFLTRTVATPPATGTISLLHSGTSTVSPLKSPRGGA